MPAFSFCILEENDLDVVNRGCLVYLNHKNTICLACMTGALWAKRGERDISRGARYEREAATIC